MKIEDRSDHSRAFREGIINFWANYKDNKQCLTFGALLHEVKTAKLYKTWGHKSFYWYCRNELHLVPANHEHIYIAIFTRASYFDLTPDEMRSIERKNSTRRLLLAGKVAKTKTKFLFFCNSRAKIQEQQQGRRTLSFGPYKSSVIDLIGMAMRRICLDYGCEKEHAPIVAAILSLLVTHKKGNSLERSVKRLCNVAKLPTEVGGKMVEVLK